MLVALRSRNAVAIDLDVHNVKHLDKNVPGQLNAEGESRLSLQKLLIAAGLNPGKAQKADCNKEDLPRAT